MTKQMCKHAWVGDDECAYCALEDANDVIAEVRGILGEFDSEDVRVMARRAIDRIDNLRSGLRGMACWKLIEPRCADIAEKTLSGEYPPDEPSPPLDAGLRYKPVLQRAHNEFGWEPEMEQAHDGEWVHISALNRQTEPNAPPRIEPRVFRGNGPDCLGCGKTLAEHLTNYNFCPGLDGAS